MYFAFLVSKLPNNADGICGKEQNKKITKKSKKMRKKTCIFIAFLVISFVAHPCVAQGRNAISPRGGEWNE